MHDWQCTTLFFENACAYCGDLWDEVEHATPLCRGGGTTIANCLPACARCNGRKHQHTLEDLLIKDLWPQRAERLKRALGWLQMHGRTATNPSGREGLLLSGESKALIKMRQRAKAPTKPWFGPYVWFGLSAAVVDSLKQRGLIQATAFEWKGLMPYRMDRQCWKIRLTEAGRVIDILQLADDAFMQLADDAFMQRSETLS